MAYIPGYLLRRIYVKGSMKATPEGLEFKLRNDLATATVTRLTVEVDGQPVEALVEISGRQVPASQITPENPLRFPRGAEARILAAGSYTKGRHRVKVTASVAGFGTGSIDIEDEAA